MERRAFLASVSSSLLAGMVVPFRGAQAAGPQLLGYLRTNWSQDPFSFGSYSYIAKGASRRDIKALAKPVEDKLFFAGEAANPGYSSTVHAAYESGVASANTVLKNKSISHCNQWILGLSGIRFCTN